MSAKVNRALLVAIVLLTFARLFGAEFVRWDDRFTLHHNPRMNPPTMANVGAYWREWRTGEYGLYMPVTQTVWSVIARVARVEGDDVTGVHLNPWVFHAANVLVHLASALIVMGILRRVFGSELSALFGAMVFAVHPVQVEAVAWASGMKDLLAGLFGLLAVWFYLCATDGGGRSLLPSPQPSGCKGEVGRGFYFGAIIACALAMLSKPSAVVVGPICLVMDVVLGRRDVRRAVMAAAPMVVMAIPIALIARHVQDAANVPPVVTWGRPVVAADAILFYGGKLLAPVQLGIDYGRQPQVVLGSSVAYVAPVVLMALGIVMWRWPRRPVVLAGSVFVLALAPVLGLATFQFQEYSTVADHYLYVAMLGVAILVAWIMQTWPTRRVTIAAGVVVGVLASLSFMQTRYWMDDFRLLSHAIAVNPKSFAAHNNFGAAWEERAAIEQALAEAARQDGDTAAMSRHDANHAEALRWAARQYDLAVRIHPGLKIAIESRNRVEQKRTAITSPPRPPAPSSQPF